METNNTLRLGQRLAYILKRSATFFIGVDHKIGFGKKVRGKHVTDMCQVSSTLAVEQTVTDTSASEGVAGFGQILTGTIRSASVQNTSSVSGFAQSVDLRLFRPSGQTGGNTVSFSQSVGGSIKTSGTQRLIQTLQLGDLLQGSPRLSKVVGFGQTLAYQLTANRAIAHTVKLTQTIMQTLYRRGQLVGQSYTVELPRVMKQMTFTSGTTTVVIRSPDYNNTRSTALGGILRKTRGNHDRLSRKGPKTTENRYQVQLTNSVQFLAFELATRGAEIQMTDHLGVTWKGFLKLEPTSYVLDNLHVLSFTFHGGRL